jgi:hypothetical protein
MKPRNPCRLRPGPGGGPDVRTGDGQTGQQIDDFFANDIRSSGGLFVAGSGHQT